MRKKSYHAPELDEVWLNPSDIIAWSGITEEDEIDKQDAFAQAKADWFTDAE